MLNIEKEIVVGLHVNHTSSNCQLYRLTRSQARTYFFFHFELEFQYL